MLWHSVRRWTWQRSGFHTTWLSFGGWGQCEPGCLNYQLVQQHLTTDILSLSIRMKRTLITFRSIIPFIFIKSNHEPNNTLPLMSCKLNLLVLGWKELIAFRSIIPFFSLNPTVQDLTNIHSYNHESNNMLPLMSWSLNLLGLGWKEFLLHSGPSYHLFSKNPMVQDLTQIHSYNHGPNNTLPLMSCRLNMDSSNSSVNMTLVPVRPCAATSGAVSLKPDEVFQFI